MFSLAGAFDRASALEFQSAVGSLGEMIKDLVIDCEKVTFVDLEGLRQLVVAQKIMQKRGSFSLCRVPSVMMEALCRTGLSQKIRVIS